MLPALIRSSLAARPLLRVQLRSACAALSTKASAEEAAVAPESASETDTQPQNVQDSEQTVDELAELKKNAEELNEKYMRALAEMENVRMRAKRDVDNAYAYSTSKFAKEMLDVADNLHRAVRSVSSEQLESGGADALRTLFDGVELTQKHLHQVFERNQISMIASEGEKFNPHVHEAMFEIPCDDQAQNGLIGQVVKEGYMFKERVLRPACVGTFKASAQPANTSNNTSNNTSSSSNNNNNNNSASSP